MEKLYNSSNPLVRLICNQRLNEIIRIIPQKKNLKILDAGCGEGQLLSRITKTIEGELYGADATEIAIETAQEKVPGVSFSLQDITNLNYKDNFFDVVICTEVIEHISDYVKAISELKRVLKDEGMLILSFPNEPLAILLRAGFFRKPIIEDHVNSFSPGMMQKIVGLSIGRKVNLPIQICDFLSLIYIMVFIK